MEPSFHYSDAKENVVSIRQRWLTVNTTGYVINLCFCVILFIIRSLNSSQVLLSISSKWRLWTLKEKFTAALRGVGSLNPGGYQPTQRFTAAIRSRREDPSWEYKEPSTEEYLNAGNIRDRRGHRAKEMA